VLINVQRARRIRDDVLLGHASQSLSDVDAGGVLDHPAQVAINEAARNGQVVSEFMLYATGDFILELSRCSTRDRREARSSLEGDMAARDVIAGSQVGLIARTRIGVERPCQTSLD